MAFSRTGLRKIAFLGTLGASTRPRVLYGYISADTLATIQGSGYFNDLIAELGVGDVIMVSASSGANIVLVTITSVTTNVAFAVTATNVVGDQTAIASLTENAGAIGGTNDGDLPSLTPTAVTTAALTATNPAAPTAYSAHASGSTPVTSNAATDLDTTAAALATLRGEVATYETAISALIVDVAAQKAEQDKLVTDLAAAVAAIREVAAKQNADLAMERTAGLLAAS